MLGLKWGTLFIFYITSSPPCTWPPSPCHPPPPPSAAWGRSPSWWPRETRSKNGKSGETISNCPRKVQFSQMSRLSSAEPNLGALKPKWLLAHRTIPVHPPTHPSLSTFTFLCWPHHIMKAKVIWGVLELIDACAPCWHHLYHHHPNCHRLHQRHHHNVLVPGSWYQCLQAEDHCWPWKIMLIIQKIIVIIQKDTNDHSKNNNDHSINNDYHSLNNFNTSSHFWYYLVWHHCNGLSDWRLWVNCDILIIWALAR